MDLPVIEFREALDEQESNLVLFMANAGTLVNGINFPQNTESKYIAVQNALNQMRRSKTFKEIGALKDDTLLQISKGGVKTNYGGSRKRECNFTLLNIKNRYMSDLGTTISGALIANGCFADFVIIDKSNAIAYSILNLELETGVKVMEKKFTEVSFKAMADDFSSNSFKAVKLFWGEKIQIQNLKNDAKSNNKHRRKKC